MDTTLYDDQHDEVFEDLISKLTGEIGQKSLASGTNIPDFWKYLQECEASFTSERYKTGAYSHDMENMLSLYMLNYSIPKKLTTILRDFKLPHSTIKEGSLESHPIWDGFVAGDGTLYAFAKYCQLDPMWTVVFVYYVWYKYIHPGGVHDFIKQPCITTFNSSSPDGARVAIIGDWGTGTYKDGNVDECPAQLVIDGIMALDKVPEYIIHLGDVYYAGTRKEERKNLINMLPSHYTGKLFTMNSNHEMYDGANGLFKETIHNSKFEPQQGSTYFSLEVEDWVIVGLDSAFYDESFLYMDGAIFNKHGGQEQVQFLKDKEQAARAAGKQLMVLTHHNPIEYDGSALTDSKSNEGSLWEQVVVQALEGRIPDAWYWGHVHNGIVYDIPELKKQGKLPKITLKEGENPKLRCCGHASMPYGKGTGLYNKKTGKNNPGISYFGETLMNPPKPTLSQHLRVLNGFAVIDIEGATFTETFYEVSNAYPGNSPKPIWTTPKKPN